MKAPTADFGLCPACRALPDLVNTQTTQFGVCVVDAVAWPVAEFDRAAVVHLHADRVLAACTLVEPHLASDDDPRDARRLPTGREVTA